MKHPHNITLQEADTLARLYLECKLTHLQETQFEYLLTNIPYDSPAIREVRSIMVPSLLIAQAAHNHSTSRPRLRHKFSFIAGMAASVTLILAASLYWIQPSSTAPQNNYIVEAYVNGTTLTDKQAEYYARKTEAQSMAMLLKAKLHSEAIQQQSMSNMNKILNSQ
ncbi:MAG: hypothetical protein K2O88_03600 [Paramuribaculum sp.]|nr:hypothetical protein [Paramuribaculum sp.]